VALAAHGADMPVRIPDPCCLLPVVILLVRVGARNVRCSSDNSAKMAAIEGGEGGRVRPMVVALTKKRQIGTASTYSRR